MNQYVALKDVAAHRIVQMRNDERYGVVLLMPLPQRSRVCHVDFWDGGAEVVDGDEMVRVLPTARKLR